MFPRLVAISCGILLLVRGVTFASSVQSSEAKLDENADTSQLETITVTARKRAESLEDVPVSVSAYSGETLERRGTTNTKDLFAVTPGLYYSQSGQRQSDEQHFLTIRGVGSSPVVEPSVGIFVDGAYVPSLGWTMDFLDLDRVEVLRGPQGALFGRNTEGGALNIVTRKPDDTFQGKVTASAANFGTYGVNGSIAGPLGNGWFANFAGFGSTTDGYVRNATLAEQEDSRVRFGGRGTLRFFPDADTDIILAVDYFHSNGRYDAYGDAVNQEFTVVDPQARLASRGTFLSKNPLSGPRYTTFGNSESGENLKNFGATLNAFHVFNGVSLTSITSYRRIRAFDTYDNDGIATATSTNGATEEQSISQEELRLASAGTGSLKWLAGLYLSSDELNQKRLSLFTSGIVAGPIQGDPNPSGFTQDDADITRRGGALFGQLIYSLTTRLDVSVGGRYSYERVRQTPDLNVQVQIPSAAPPPPFKPTIVQVSNTQTQAKDFSGFSPSGSISYKLTPDVLTYALVSKGYKGGGFTREVPNSTLQNAPLENEISLNYEVGSKGEFLNRHVLLNAAVFYTAITNEQLSTRIPLAPGSNVYIPSTQNVGKGHSEGVELEAIVRPVGQLTLNASASFTETRFDTYLAEPATNIAAAYSRAGQAFPEVPKWTGSFIAEYGLTVSGQWTLTPQVSWRYVGGTYVGAGTTALPFLAIPAYNLGDAQLTLSNRVWKIAGYTTNLTDRRYITFPTYLQGALAAPGYQSWARYGAPREYGIRATYQF